MVQNYPIHLVQNVRKDSYYFHSSRRSISVTRQVMDASGRAPSGHSAHCRSARTGEHQHLSRPCFGYMLAIKLSAREHTWGYTPHGSVLMVLVDVALRWVPWSQAVMASWRCRPRCSRARRGACVGDLRVRGQRLTHVADKATGRTSCLFCRMFAILAMTKLAEKPVDGYIDCA